MTKTATEMLDKMPRSDLRRMRTHPIIASMMKIIGEHAPDANMRAIYYGLADMLCEAGAEIITDYQRAELGLPPRGPDGWTSQEIVALERMRLEMLTAPLRFSPPSFQEVERQKDPT